MSKLEIGIEELQRAVLSKRIKSGKRFYSRRGTRIQPAYWAQLQNDRQYRIVARDEFEEADLTTFWTGISATNKCDARELPFIFTTIAETGTCTHEWSTATQEAAGAVHAIIASQLRQGIAANDIQVSTPYN